MMQILLQWSLRNRGIAVVCGLVLCLLTALNWKNLTLDAVPEVTNNQVQIFTETGGMSPSEIEKLVTFPIENAMNGLPNSTEIRSLSQFGLSIVTVVFKDEVDIYAARTLVAEKLNSIRSTLPTDVTVPVLGPVTTGLGEVFMYAIDSKSRSITDLRELQDWVVAPRLRSVPGVAEVNSMDGHEKQFQVVLNLDQLNARRISVETVVEALRKNNRNVGGGFLERGGERIQIRSVGMLTSIKDIEATPVTGENGSIVRVKDIAEVKIGNPILTGVSTRDGHPSLIITVLMLKGANGQTVANAVGQRLNEISQTLPKDVTLIPVYSRANVVDSVLNTVAKSLLEGAILVVIVLMLLLGNVRGALISAVTIPLAMMVAILAMQQLKISGNLLSLGAIDFGIIVDGAVIMVENCVRRLGEKRHELGRRLSKLEYDQVLLLATTEVRKVTQFGEMIVIATFIPILTLEGTEGKMFKPMALVFIFALLGALILSITLIPALCSLLLGPDTIEKPNRLMDILRRGYAPLLCTALKQKQLLIGASVVIVGSSLFVFSRLGSEFVPVLDEGSLVIQPTRMRTVNIDETLRMVQAAEKQILTIPEVKTVFSRSGTPDVATDPMPLSLTDSFIMWKPRESWRPGMNEEKLREEVEKVVSTIPGQTYTFTQPIQMRFDELVSGVKAEIGIKVFGEDLREIKQKADLIAETISTIPGATDVEVEQVDDVPVLQFDLDREAMGLYGLTVDDVQTLFGVALGGEVIGQIVEGDRRFGLSVQLPPLVKNDAEALKQIRVVSPSGDSVTLGDIATIANRPAPAQISREMGKRRVVIQLNVRGRDLGSFVAEAKRRVAEKVPLSERTYLVWGGQFENMERASKRLAIAIPCALALILGLLYFTFGSFKQALLVFSGVPLAISGGVFGLALRGLPFSVSAGIGFIALSGVAVLNGVVLLTAINRLAAEGLPWEEAVCRGSEERLRPVLMTALVASLGFIPMAVNTGLGSEVQRPLATVVIFGVVTAAALTLIVLPVLASMRLTSSKTTS